MIYITPIAQKHFTKLLAGKKPGTQIRVFVVNPGTVHAKCNVCFCPPEEFKTSDVVIEFDLFSVHVDSVYVSFLKDAKIDVMINELDSQLTIKAPNATKECNNTRNNMNNDLLEDRVRNVLQFQINPQLELHGGSVSLIRITEDLLAVIKFYGGCNGCAMASYTIKEGIETTLKNLFPELKGVLDMTQHQHGTHSFY
ncbi:membrane-bound protein in GNT I transport system [Candidatus Blochmanniella pennsylvanica str. BPEN]|uniref:Fe/S biogenesis protein NfuA n=1 Tax=Blochmanniella pennsylvanica (strain BPEN) TaxID=291272 RepID=NFUA_BLOPB|nr:NfuA family Fe-S biogenesis protein [Candidatus Blochmannia pennsylvanicus]Q492A3.1 RecName: Full=Fe/S biogenesis protein NfuA [Candidatus Blochmannia pennsylvanicus str. BPEN]AAZ41199.1 membrane-bound protein in GNT I transport system [Candidatus Blochmannia pennsylvanicus str. BPEN]UOY04387.1 NfuA family Fe-S biogenesis protein [Candidatus Blochmannia pennsylvanicus]